MGPLLLLFLACSGLVHGVDSPSSEDWRPYAYRLTGESDAVRTQALRKIASIPALEPQLQAALQDQDKYLALDVIVALNLKSFLDRLLVLSERDETGAFYLAINTLFDKQETKRIFLLYRERLIHPSSSIPARVVIMDTLARVGIDLKDVELKLLSENSTYELQSALLSYCRLRLLRSGRREYLPFVGTALGSPYFQVRVQAIHLLKDLPREVQRHAKSLFQQCVNDRDESIRTLCQQTESGVR